MWSYSKWRQLGSGQRSRGLIVTSGYGPCNLGLGKNSGITDELIFDDLGFRESAELPMLPYLEPFSLQLYDVEDPNTPVATYDSLVVTSENPQALILLGLKDTTAYTPNPEGYSIRENALLLDLPVLTNNPNEVRQDKPQRFHDHCSFKNLGQAEVGTFSDGHELNQTKFWDRLSISWILPSAENPTIRFFSSFCCAIA